MEKPSGDGYLHADDKEQGGSLRPPDELQLANMNEPEKQKLDARTKKRKTGENGGRDPADDELPLSSPSLPSPLSSSAMEQPDGGGYFQADTNEKGVPLLPPHEFKLTDMNEPERHELDAGTKKRKTREAGGDWAEEQQKDRERKMMLQGNEGASAEEVVDLMEDLGMELQAEEAEPVEEAVDLMEDLGMELQAEEAEPEEEAVDLMEDLGMELQAEEAEPEEEAIDVIEEDLALHRRQQGIGATVQYLRDTEADWSLDQQVQLAAGTGEAPRNLAPVSGCNINALPLVILEDILMRINSASIRNAVSSSFVFVRAAMTLCKCNAFRDNGSFIAAIVQPSYGRPSVTAPERQRHHPLSSAANMLDRFLTVRYNALHWYRIIDSRKGYLLIQRNHSANQFDVMRPFLTMRVVTLPLIDLRQQELVTAAIVPEASPHFVVMMLSRKGLDVTLREFRSRQGMWIQQRVQCSLVFPALPESRRQPLYSSDKLYLLDAPKQRVLCFSCEQNLLDSIRLPASVDGACVKTSTLSRTRNGQVCWAALDHSGVSIFALDGVSWRKKRRWPVPQHFYSSRLIGFAEDSEQVMVGCFEEVCCINIEEGSTTYLKEAPAADSCVAFEVDHVVVDHE